MLNEKLICAEDISYSYSNSFNKSAQNPSVDHISFHLKRGEILAFLGPNGAGKSTTMSLLTGNLPSQSGTITISGFDLQKQSLQAKNCIGYLPDKPPLYNDLRVDEYLIYCGQLHKLTHQQIIKSLDYVKQRCGLTSFSNRLISQLSKGIQQRIGIAQAIIHQPDIIILDEPTNGLDPVQKHEILSLIQELGETHSVLISTHSWSDVQQAGCDKVQIINQGQLVYKDSLFNLKQQLQGHNLTLCCSNRVDTGKIQSINGVESIQAINAAYSDNGECFEIKCQDSLDRNEIQQLSSLIVDLSSQQGWGLYEIKINKKSFDSVFLSLAQI
jgi:gliding motility-associated transport system ATP-binding protein